MRRPFVMRPVGSATLIRGPSHANTGAVIVLGGTITMMEGERPDLLPRLSDGSLTAVLPDLEGTCELRPTTFRTQPTPHLTFNDIVELAALVRQEIRSGARGVVVVQGTDTLEEKAFALDLPIAEDALVVVTGSMREPEHPGVGGRANLLAAVRVAADASARGVGTLVVLEDEIYAARFVRKGHTTRVGAFVSLPGPVGSVHGRRGIVTAGCLDGSKARVLLTLLLRAGLGVADVRWHFVPFGGDRGSKGRRHCATASARRARGTCTCAPSHCGCAAQRALA